MNTVSGSEDTYAIVKQAWVETLPGRPFDPALGWEDAGADSLKSLHLVMRLEKALGRSVSFDLISREMTARDLALLLDGKGGETATETTLPTVYLVPGLFGDGPILAEFRRSFGGSVKFELVELPDMDVPARVHADMAQSGRHVAERIMQLHNGGDIYLAGFSFGGTVAYEAAQHLLRKEHRVAFLGLLDSFPDPGLRGEVKFDVHDAQAAKEPEPAQPEAKHKMDILGRVRPRRGESLRGYLERALFGAAVHFGMIDAARKLTLAQRERLTQDQIIGRRKIVLGLSRQTAIHRWAPEPLDTPTFLVCTDEGERRNLPERWTMLCPRLDILRVPGEHLDIFTPPSLALLTPAFESAVKRAADGRWS